MHKELLVDKFLDIIECIDIVEARFIEINSPEDFVSSVKGVEKLDSISMRLQTIGEIVSKIYKKESALLEKYPQIKWNDIIGMRNVISHAYMEIDHNVIYKTCKTHLPVLKETINSIISRLNESKD
jgi:uncharacterized protein with HEPN domain